MDDHGLPVAGVDLGGTKILVGIVDASDKILGKAKRSTPAKEGGDAIVATILDALKEAAELAGVAISDLLGIGVGSPGPLDPASGMILHSSNLNVQNFPLGGDLSAATGRPVLVRNDVRMGTYGEFRLGAGRGYHDILAAFVGTGIGGCTIQNGKIVEGSTGNAGEIGHIVVKAGGPKCGCGRLGCLEALASKSAMTRRIAKAIRHGVATTLSETVHSKTSRLKSRELKAAFEAGDAVAVKEVRRAAHFLGLALGGLVNLLGPEIIVIGGGVAGALGEPFIDLVRVSARDQALTDPDGTIPIVLASLGDDAGVLGAALMARESFGAKTG